MRLQLFFEDRLEDFANVRQTDVRLMGLNCLRSVVRGLFLRLGLLLREAPMAVWSKRLNIWANTGAMWE